MKYKNKGFTLIEILAVVTIIGLIFILVIPKITTSLKNKKGDVDKTTENLVLSATKLYVSDHSSKFEKTDGNISCMPLHQLVKKGYLDGPVKNVTDDKDITNGKSVRITYDKGFKYELVDSGECKVKYIQLATKYLLKKTNPITITNYTDGDIHEMYTFEHEATEQTPALTDYRYIGSDPNNYVEFNNELWRIVGVFKVEDGNGYWEYRVKIVRNEFLSSTKAWGSNNEWSTSSLNTYLNNEYLTSLSVQSQNMIRDATYYLGGRHSISNLSDTLCYNFERSTSVYAYDERKLNWSGKFALMYPSDYIYTFALGVDSYCNLNGGKCSIDNGGNPSKSWVYNIGGGSKSQWLISQDSSYPIVAYQIYKSGFIDNYNSRSGYVRVGGKCYINPALYLSSKVKITSGNGSINNAYKLSI